MPKLLKRLLGWFFAFAFIALTTAGAWLPFVITHAVEKDYHFPEVAIDATVGPNGDLVLEERRTFDFRNGPFTYAYFDVQDANVTGFTIAELHADGSETPVTPDYAGPSVRTASRRAGASTPRTRTGPGSSATRSRAPSMSTATPRTCTGSSSAPGGTSRRATRSSRCTCRPGSRGTRSAPSATVR